MPRRVHAVLLCLALGGPVAACRPSTAIGPDAALVKPLGDAASAAKAAVRKSVATGGALIAGTAVGPAGVVGGNIVVQNSSRLVSNNGSGVISNNGSAIVAQNSSRYVLLAVSQAPITRAVVYLTDPDERFYTGPGDRPVTATTDGVGKYAFESGLPPGEIIIVNVILSDNRREVGFTVAKNGKNVVDVSLATNYVTEFLRSKASRAGKTMADYNLDTLPELTRLTQKALDAGDLPVPTLGIGEIAAMNQQYALAVGLDKQGLANPWAKLLGQRVLAMTTFAGSGESGLGGDGKAATAAQLYKPKGLAKDSAGNTYIADEGNHLVRKVAADGTISTFAGKGVPQFSGDGGAAKDAGLWWPRTLICAPGDVLYIADTLNMRIRRVPLKAGTIETVAGDPSQVNGAFLNDFAGDGAPATAAKLAGARGIALDSTGAVLFADSWDNDGGSWHHIRRIDRDGTISSLVGVDGKHGYNGDGKPGRETQINYVNQIAVDAQDNVFFADAKNHRIRRFDARSKVVTTVAGDGTDGTRGDGGPATSAQLSSPYGVAVDSLGRVFISERGSKRLRMVDTAGQIRTIAGGGSITGDGEAEAVALVEPHDLFIEPDGNLLVADSRAAKVRRLWLQWGL